MKLKQVPFLVIGYYVFLVACFWYLSSDTPARVRFWHSVTKTTQTVARTFGNAGLYAEKRYYRAVEETRA